MAKQATPIRVPDELREVVLGICRSYRETPLARESIKVRLETLLEEEWTDPNQTAREVLELLADIAQDIKDGLEQGDRIEAIVSKFKV